MEPSTMLCTQGVSNKYGVRVVPSARSSVSPMAGSLTAPSWVSQPAGSDHPLLPVSVSAAADRGSLTLRPFWPLRFFFLLSRYVRDFGKRSAQAKILLGIRIPDCTLNFKI